MEVILLERIEKLGQMGDVVKVKDGFARNFLLPQKKALRASDDNLAYFEKERVTLEANNLEQKKEAEEVLNETNKRFNGKIQTNISKFKNYCKAEEYHQKYIEKKNQ